MASDDDTQRTVAAAQPSDADKDRALAALIIRGVAGAAAVTAAVSSDPIVDGVATGTKHLLGLVARLVEMHGRDKAHEILQRLVEDPARPITTADLDADVEKVKREFGL